MPQTWRSGYVILLINERNISHPPTRFLSTPSKNCISLEPSTAKEKLAWTCPIHLVAVHPPNSLPTSDEISSATQPIHFYDISSYRRPSLLSLLCFRGSSSSCALCFSSFCFIFFFLFLFFLLTSSSFHVLFFSSLFPLCHFLPFLMSFKLPLIFTFLYFHLCPPLPVLPFSHFPYCPSPLFSYLELPKTLLMRVVHTQAASHIELKSPAKR